MPSPQSRGCFAHMKPWLSGGPPPLCHRTPSAGMDPIYPAGSRMDPPYPALTSLSQAAPKTEGQSPSSGCQAGAPPLFPGVFIPLPLSLCRPLPRSLAPFQGGRTKQNKAGLGVNIIWI